MARFNSKNPNHLTGLMLIIIFVWFILLTILGNIFGQLGLGVMLLVGGVWTLARSKQIWVNYQAAWKKLPARARKSWNQPRAIYYYINIFILIPLSIVLGIALIVLAYIRF